MRRLKKNERGVALLATLMAVALMTIEVVDFTSSATLGYRAAANQANELRADYLARSGIAIGLALLSQQERMQAQAGNNVQTDANGQPLLVDSLNQPWAQPYGPVPVGGGYASVQVIDEERKLPINALVLPNGVPNQPFLVVLEKLFALLKVKQEIIPALIDWLDPDSVPQPDGGAEADYYLGLIPPYEPRNGPMPTIGDLRMVRGVDDATFAVLQRFLTVIPENQLNLNTAPGAVLGALLPGLEDADALKEFMALRMETPFASEADLANVPGLGDLPTPQDTGITPVFRSDYFTIIGTGSYAGARKIVFATVRRQGGLHMLTSWDED